MKYVLRHTLAVLLAFALFLPAAAGAASVDELERRLDLVTDELQKLKNEQAISEDPEYKSTFGLGPAASKIYQVAHGLSVGGYGEAHYTNFVSDKTKNDEADFVRAILYVGYKFTDNILFNSEIEFEHGSTDKDGSVSVELAQIDFLINEGFNLRGGMVLIPVGITNELHEPTLYHGNDRPLVETQVIPSTWRELGIGAFGELAEGLDYKLYLVNGFDAAKFDAKGLRGGRQKGSKAKADDWAVVARLDYEPVLGLQLGASTYLGDSGQNQEFAGDKPNVFTQIYEVHGQYKRHGLELKALASRVEIDDNDKLSLASGKSVPERISGWYGEVAYDLLPLLVPATNQYLAPFLRYESIDYGQSAEDVELWVSGLSYKPIPNVVVKADYRNFNHKFKSDAADEVNFGIGYIF